MRIAIIEADRPDPEVRHRWPSYGGMFETWLGAVLPEARFARANIAEGEGFPQPADFDAVVLTGSRHGAYEPHDWIPVYEGFLRTCRDAGKPIGAFCFGHQILAQAFGGRVGKSERGWAIGRKVHRIADAGRAHFPQRAEIAALSFHQDQVEVLPPGARVLLGNDHSPNGGLAYPFPALSVQFHPEFGADYLSGLLDRLPPGDIDDRVVRQGREGLDRPIDSDEVALTFARFYRLHCGAGTRAG